MIIKISQDGVAPWGETLEEHGILAHLSECEAAGGAMEEVDHALVISHDISVYRCPRCNHLKGTDRILCLLCWDDIPKYERQRWLEWSGYRDAEKPSCIFREDS